MMGETGGRRVVRIFHQCALPSNKAFDASKEPRRDILPEHIFRKTQNILTPGGMFQRSSLQLLERPAQSHPEGRSRKDYPP